MQQVAAVSELKSTTFGGRRFTRQQLEQVVETVSTFKNLSRKELALTIAEHFSWKNVGNALKVNSALTLLENLEARGLVKLPPKRQTKQPRSRRIELSDLSAPSESTPSVRAELDEIGPIELQLATSDEDIRMFNELIERHHYLGYRQTVGQSLRYFVVAKGLDHRKLGCLLFTPASFAMKARDAWIGWKRHHRTKRLPFVVCNRRFLILPSVQVPNLASKALSLVPGRVTDDWQRIHGAQPVLIESFVNPAKFTGACYQASNWQLVGQTSEASNFRQLRGDDMRKDIYAYPLRSDFRQILTGKKRWPPKEESKETEILAQQSFTAADAVFAAMWAKIVAAIAEVARCFDGRWQKRKRVIDSLFLVMMILRLVGNRDRKGYGSTIDDMWDNCDKVRIALPQRDTIASSSFASARLKLDESIFKEINDRIVQIYEAEFGGQHLWRGLRVFAVDGTKVNVPRGLLKNGYTRPNPEAHYPQALGSCLYNLMTAMPHDFGLYSCKDERHSARKHLKTLEQGDVVVYDRGYFSYAMLRRHHSAGIPAVFRLKRKLYDDIESFWKSDETDKVITLLPEGPTRRKIEALNKGVEVVPLQLRLIKYFIEGKAYVIGTTLFDQTITTQDFQDIYHKRWELEELYKTLKLYLAAEQFHAKSERGVKQEFNALCLLVSLNRTVAHHADKIRPAPTPGPLAPSTPTQRQTNFKNLLGAMHMNLESLLYRGTSLFRSIGRLIKRAVKRSLPVRPGRKYPRISHRVWGLRWKSSSPRKTEAPREARARRIAGIP